MATISQEFAQLRRYFTTHSKTTHGMCLQNIIVISLLEGTTAGTKNRAYILNPAAAAAATLSTQIGPSLHVGPNNIVHNVWRT